MYSFQLIKTEDGSHSIYVAELNETYHSVHGAITESKHVFIKNGFRYLVSLKNQGSINILEIGFGTGLNVYLTLLENRIYNCTISYISVEPYPLSQDIISGLNYASILGDPENKIPFQKIHDVAWDENVPLHENFLLHKINCKYQNYIPGINHFDLIYYDAFAPGKQPEMWESSLLQKSADSLVNSGILVTYSAKGQVKRDLKATGLQVETLQGAPGKKEMTRASKL